jgi:hypothetical protein
MSAPRIYNARNVSLTIAAIQITEGLVNVEIAPKEQWIWKQGIRDGCWSSKFDPMVEITVTLLNSSVHNTQFSKLHGVDSNSNGGAGIGILSLIDNGGATVIVSNYCRIQKAPNWKIQEEAFEAPWIFHALIPPEFYQVGGN